MNNLLKAILIFLVSYSLLRLLVEAVREIFQIGIGNFATLGSVIVISYYFARKCNRPLFWKEAFIFSFILFLLGVIAENMLTLWDIGFPTQFILFLMRFSILIDLIILKLVSYLVFKATTFRKKHAV